MILDFSNQHHSLLLTLVAVKVSWPFQLSRLKPLESFCTLVFLLRHFQFVSKSYWPYIQNVFQVQPLLTNTGSTLIQVTVSLLLIISVVFHWSLCSCLCFPVIYSQYSGLGDPVRTFRSCYSSAQHLSLAYRSTQSKIQCLSQPPICGPLPSDPPLLLTLPLPPFTPLRPHWPPCYLSSIPGLLPTQDLPFIVPSDEHVIPPDLHMDGSLPRCRPLLRCYLLSESSRPSSLPTNHGPRYFPSLCYFSLRHTLSYYVY